MQPLPTNRQKIHWSAKVQHTSVLQILVSPVILAAHGEHEDCVKMFLGTKEGATNELTSENACQQSEILGT